MSVRDLLADVKLAARAVYLCAAFGVDMVRDVIKEARR